MRLATLYTLYGRRAGAELFVERTLRELCRCVPDLRLTVFCNEQARRSLAQQLPSADIRRIPWLDHQMGKAFWLEFLAPRAVRRRDFDVFWIPSGSAAFPGPWDVPTVVTFLDMGVFLVKGRFDFKRTFYRKHISTPRSLRRAAAFTAISRATADDACRIFPQARRPVVIHPGASPLAAQSQTQDPATVVEKETGLRLNRILFSPARTDYIGKGRDILLRAYADYRRAVPEPLPLVMPGPRGEFHESVMADIETLGLRGHAIWPGRVSDDCIHALYRLSCAMILPSRSEGFGFPVLEAMQHGVPVICSDAGSLSEIAGDAALIFASGDTEQLKNALLRIHSDAALRDDLVRKGLERCRVFSWEETARKYVAVFQEVAQGGEPGRSASPPTR